MDQRFAGLTHIFMDADDTLWENDIYFRAAEDEFAAFIAPYVRDVETFRGDFPDGELTPEVVARRVLFQKQEENIPIFGYGSKTYLLGMLDAAAQLAPDRFGPAMYRDIKDIVTKLAMHPLEWLPEAERTVRELAKRYRIVIATKGDLCEQMRKVRESGILDCVESVEVMEKKNVWDYGNLAAKMGVPPSRIFMVGNTVRSDVAPVIEGGGWAAYLPYITTWTHELMPLPDSNRILQLERIDQLLGILM